MHVSLVFSTLSVVVVEINDDDGYLNKMIKFMHVINLHLKCNKLKHLNEKYFHKLIFNLMIQNEI